jgi:hypothetical protein
MPLMTSLRVSRRVHAGDPRFSGFEFDAGARPKRDASAVISALRRAVIESAAQSAATRKRVPDAAALLSKLAQTEASAEPPNSHLNSSVVVQENQRDLRLMQTQSSIQASRRGGPTKSPGSRPVDQTRPTRLRSPNQSPVPDRLNLRPTPDPGRQAVSCLDDQRSRARSSPRQSALSLNAYAPSRSQARSSSSGLRCRLPSRSARRSRDRADARQTSTARSCSDRAWSSRRRTRPSGLSRRCRSRSP